MYKVAANTLLGLLIALSSGCKPQPAEDRPKTGAVAQTEPGAVEKEHTAEEGKVEETSMLPNPESKTENETAKDDGSYRELDPAELYVAFHGELTSLLVDADGNGEARGNVKRMAVGGTEIKLASDELINEGGSTYVETEEYGKIKVTFNSNAQATIWVTPSQKQKLLQLKKQQVTDQNRELSREESVKALRGISV